MNRWIDLDDSRNCFIGEDGDYERYSIDPDVLKEAVWHWKFRCHVCGFSVTVARTDVPNHELFSFCPHCGGDLRNDFHH